MPNDRAILARTIAGLYNNAKVQGLGFLHAQDGKMTPETAGKLADQCIQKGPKGMYFDYYLGRVMKISVSSSVFDALDFSLYDRDNGQGAGMRAVAHGLMDPTYAELD